MDAEDGKGPSRPFQDSSSATPHLFSYMFIKKLLVQDI